MVVVCALSVVCAILKDIIKDLFCSVLSCPVLSWLVLVGAVSAMHSSDACCGLVWKAWNEGGIRGTLSPRRNKVP